MKTGIDRWFFAIAFTVSFLTVARTHAQEKQEHKANHHHYKLIVVEPLGGPASSASGPYQQILNNRGMFAAYANTATPNPNPDCIVPFSPSDCFVERPVVWHNGTLTELELLPGGENGQTVAISPSGIITGWSENGRTDPQTGLPEFDAVLWAGDRVINLGTLPGGNESGGFAINSRGQVVGGSSNGILDAFSIAGFTTQTRAFLWQNGVLRDLGTLGGFDSIAFNLNEQGRVAGISYTDSNPSSNCQWALTTHPFFWENGKMTDVGSLGGSCGAVNWMNNRSQVVGFSNLLGDQNSHAFLWDKEHGLKDLGTFPGGNSSNANWINDAGQVVGNSDNGTVTTGALWKNGAIIDLGILPGDCFSDALAINSSGQIVGHSSPDCVIDGNAVLWENGGAPVNLNTLVSPGSGVTAVFPLEINDRGEIAAHAFTSLGDQRAVLLIPCDENHQGIEGCDYSLVEGDMIAHRGPGQVSQATAAASAPKVSAAEMRKRARFSMTNRFRRFGTLPPK